MKVLVASESFLRGGLESQILNQVSELSSELDYVFSFGNYLPRTELEDFRVYRNNLAEGGAISCYQIRQDVLQLTEIIEKEEVDVIHAHPFFSLPVVMFAAALTQKPVVYTLHGVASIHPSDDFVYQFFQRFFFAQMEADVITVNTHLEHILKFGYRINNLHYLPNSIAVDQLSSVRRDPEGKWALVSRLDPDRISEIKIVIENLDLLGLQQVDVFGTGSVVAELKELVSQLGFAERVSFKGFVPIAEALQQEDYCGVIGQGQIVLEALAAGLPVLLASYGRLTGLVDEDLFTRIAPRNFINTFEPDVSLERISAQIASLRENPDQYCLAPLVRRDFSNAQVIPKYRNILQNARFTVSASILEFWVRFDAMMRDVPSVAAEQFFGSGSVCQLICDVFDSAKVIDPALIDLMRQTKQSIRNENSIEEIRAQLLNNAAQLAEINASIADLRQMGMRSVLRNTARTIARR